MNNAWPYGAPEGQTRRFHALIPNVDRDVEVGVVFSWHGIGQDLESWVQATRVDNAQPDFPFIVISPHDLSLIHI